MSKSFAVPEALRKFFQNNPRVAIAFSGGTDSAYLLYAAKQCRCEVHAYYVYSQFQPRFEREDAEKLAEELEIPIKIRRIAVIFVNRSCSGKSFRRHRRTDSLYSAMGQMQRMIREIARECVLFGNYPSVLPFSNAG